MASSSVSTPSYKYDVFLSFRGEDTRTNFTDHLRAALIRYGIRTFIDGQLGKGDQISPALLQAIQDSRFSIVIFSENYASSSWCLDELTQILECVDKGGQTAFPVFCEVDPSHVRHQRGSYEEAFKKHEEAHKNNMEKVVMWREALTRASGYSGWDTRGRHQSEVVTEIISKILHKVPVNPPSNNKIGMDSRIKEVLSLLCIGSHDVRMVGIWGMAGIGKTTLAEAIYQRIHTQFEGHCFLSNVREKSQRKENLKMELLSELLHEENLLIRNFYKGSDSIRKALHSKQVLIVLDDVNHIKQLEELVGHLDWFGPESRIIITTRDKRLLIQKDVDEVYEAKELQIEEARKLFYQHAFKDKSPTKDFIELCNRSLDYTKGNPLAIRILGSLLYRRTKKEWVCELEKLKKFPNKDVQEVLRISFDGLEDFEKNIFLDIACFFKEEDKDYTSELLKCCNFYPETGIPTLIERALITISDDNRLCMHDLIQEMGWEIVRQESIEFPGKRSRLWMNEDVEDVLATNSGTETIQGIVVDLSTSKELLDFSVDVFTKMIRLRLLEFRIFNKWLYNFEELSAPYKMCLRGDFKFLSKNLKYLRWEGYPLKSLSSNFDPRKLFELNMRFSQLEQLWEGYKSFQNLGYMDLSHSRDLIRTPDLSGAPELKKIYLEGCRSLIEVHSSIETLEKLSFLSLRYCSKLKQVAKSFCKLTSLESVDFSGCSELRKLPNDLRMSSPYLDLSGCSKLEELPKRIGELTSLKTPDLSGCSKVKKWPDNEGRSLVSLNLFGCSQLVELPESIGELTSLKTLNLTSCSKLEKLPKSIGKLTFLETLNLIGCSELKKLPDNVGRLQRLEKLVADGSGIQKVPCSISLLTRLKELSLGGCKIGGSSINMDLSNFISSSRLPSFLKSLKLRDFNLLEVGFINSLRSLRYLDLSGNSFISLPSLSPLTELLEFRLEGCKSLRVLTELPLRIETVWASNCESLETFSHPPNSYAKLLSRELKFDFSNCGRLLENEESLEAILGGIRITRWFCEDRRFRALVPGSRVPKWFIRGNEGNSIIVKLPSDFHDLKAVGLGFCALLGQNLWSFSSDHLWLGYHTISKGTFSTSKRVSHLKFSFPLEVKECGIRLLHLPVQSEENRNGQMIIERETVNATIVSPPPSLIFCEESCWKTNIRAEYADIHPAQTKNLIGEPSLTLCIEVEGYNIYAPQPVMATSLTQDLNQ